MKTYIKNSKYEIAKLAGEKANEIITKAISEKGMASIILATGASQDQLIEYVVDNAVVDWTKVVIFHLDEYINISEDHPASFRKYLKEHFLDKVGSVKETNFVIGDSLDAEAECNRLGSIIADYDIDIAFVGIGENGHLAFNDPPADFTTTQPFIVVELDDRCRMQQVNEGCFPSLKEVPQKAISMSVQQIMKSRNIICFVPDLRKSEAVKNCLEKEVSNMYPASILRKHPSCFLYLDSDSSSLLQAENWNNES